MVRFWACLTWALPRLALLSTRVNIWVANLTDNTVSKLRASDGANLGAFATGSVPVNVAFDGANIWVTNAGDSTPTKLRASDGANLGTFPVGSGPTGVAFDGAKIWVSSFNDNTVMKLRAAMASICKRLPPVLTPQVLAFDGASMWVVNEGKQQCEQVLSGCFSDTDIATGVSARGNQRW